MKTHKYKSAFFILLVMLTAGVRAQTIKVGSIAPDRSPWNDALQEIGREWLRISDGKVRLRIYPGGIAGSEEDMIRKIRLGTLGAALLTNVGMSKLHDDAFVMNVPFIFHDEAELGYVLEKMKPVFEEKIEEKGFKVIVWSMSGWLHFFSKDRVLTPDDLKRHKLSFMTGEPELEQAFKKAGYHIVPTELNDLMMALQSGMVNAFYLSPLLAGSGQYFPFAPNMLDLKVSPLLGGIVVSARIWRQIPPEQQKAMLEVSARISSRLVKEADEVEKKTMAAMKEHGLKVVEVNPQIAQSWRESSGEGMEELVGKSFSKEVYDLVLRHLQEYRRNK